MIKLDPIESILHRKVPEGSSFEPSEVWLTEGFVSPEKGSDAEEDMVDEELRLKADAQFLTPRYPKENQVIAIDTTSLTLGHILDGVVGAIRASVVVKPANESRWKLERYGPYLVSITEQEKEALYQELYTTVHGVEASPRALDLLGTLEQTRNLFERYIQQEVVRGYKDSLILLDGSLVAAAIVKPSSFVKRVVDQAKENNNAIAAISKTTRLTLERSRRNILSLLEAVRGPCYIGGVKGHIKRNRDRYLGDIYVVRFTPLGEPFRVDLPENTHWPHVEVLNLVSGLAGDHGYPEELRLAHMTCVLSAIEVLELQSAAMALHKLVIKEELRPRLFPL